MSKFAHLLALGTLLFLIGASFFAPNSAIFWLAAATPQFALIRGFLAVLAVLLLSTNPPRHPALRLVVGITSVVLLGWTVSATYANHMQIFDSVSLLGVGIIFGVTALEREPDHGTIPAGSLS